MFIIIFVCKFLLRVRPVYLMEKRFREKMFFVVVYTQVKNDQIPFYYLIVDLSHNF